MTDFDRDGPSVERGGSRESATAETRQLPTSRRTFVGLVGAVATSVGIGSVSGTATADETGTSGYGVGGYGEGGYGVGGYRTVEYYADDDGIVRSHGVDDATEDWERGVIDTSLLLEVIDAWRSGEVVG